MAMVGPVVRARRIALGLTQADLAAQIGDGVRQTDISRIESGVVDPPRGVSLERLAAVLGLACDELHAGPGWVNADRRVSPDGSKDRPTSTTGPEKVIGAESLDEALALARGLVQTLEALRQESSGAPAPDRTHPNGSADVHGPARQSPRL